MRYLSGVGSALCLLLLGFSFSIPVNAGEGPVDERWQLSADTVADLVVFDNNTGKWHVKSLARDGNTVHASGLPLGTKGFIPLTGKVNGDNITDLIVVDPATAKWYARNVSGGPAIFWDEQWGAKGFIPMTGEFNGGPSELVTYDPKGFKWYIRDESGPLLWAFPLGFAGVKPLIGDFDGDGRDDLCVVDTKTFRWYAVDFAAATFLPTLTGPQSTIWNIQHGYAGVEPLSGNLDGLGGDELIVYDPKTYRWYARTVDGTAILSGFLHGFKGGQPVVRDFDGDGVGDLGIYDPATGKWYIRDVKDNFTIAWGESWGFPGAIIPDRMQESKPDIGTPGSGGTFLWKPFSESNGKLVVLLPSSYTGRVKEVYLANQDGERLERGAYSGVHNGGREHYRYSKTGPSYGNNIYVIAVLENGSKNHWFLPRTGSRVEY